MLQQLAHPLTITLGLIALGVLLLLIRRRRTAILVLLLGLAWTWLLATPLVADRLVRSLENRYTPTEIDRIPTADAIVILGGGVAPEARPRNGPNLTHAADRIYYGARLYQAGKAPLIITTGTRPYADEGPSAADAQAQILRDLGIPAEDIVAPGRSTRTYTDATITREIVDERGLGRVLLVTSAMHMHRAMATFRSVGVRVYPAPTDFEVTETPWAKQYSWLPDRDAFWQSGRALHEYIGLAWYRWQGWI